MAVESKIKIKQQPVKDFPKLMVWTGIGEDNKLIVLLQNPKEGVVLSVHNVSKYSVGDYRTDWVPDGFEDFNDTIELKNS